MRLKITIPRDPKHKDGVIAVGWMNSDEMISAGDDQQILKWDLINYEAHLLLQMPNTFYPTDMHWFITQAKHTTNDAFVLTSTEGKYYICSRGGRIEKVVDAHKGAVLCGRWSHDGSSIVTCGEDGSVKMWSRNGMLRSILSQNGSPVYSASWSPDGSSVLYCAGDNCFIKALRTQVSVIKWKAHDGVILCTDWNANNNMIITGGEDCKYKVWDEYGRAVYSSSSHDYPVTSVAWSDDGELFAVGSFNLLRLCDKAGWSYSLEKLSNGSIYSISWSPDGTQLAGACADCSVVHAHLVDRRISWRNIEAVQTKRRLIDIRNIQTDVGREKLELRDRATKLALGFEHLVVTTTKQCYIYSSKNWNTPVISDLKECNASLLLLCEKCFLLIDGDIIHIYNYEGRLLCILKLPTSAGGDPITEKTAAISNDTTVIRDKIDHKCLHLFETTTGKNTGDGKIVHTGDIIEVAIDQCGTANDRKVAFIDKSLDCFLALVKTYGITQKVAKLGSMVTNIRFNDQTNMLAGLQDNRLIIWGHPSAAFIDKQLLPKTIIEKNEFDFGKAPYLIAFVGNHISVRRSDGALIPCTIAPFSAVLCSYVAASKWDQAVRLCRHIKEDYLWGMLATMAANSKNFYAAEIAYSALDEVEKVSFLSELRGEQSKDLRSAMMTAFTGNVKDADIMLVQNGLYFRAIMLNIQLFRWQRALELAVTHKMHLETVIGYRNRYLQETGRRETDHNFLQHMPEVEIDWEHIQETIREDESKDL